MSSGFVVVRRHFIAERGELVSAGWIFDCPGCREPHYLTTLTHRYAAEWELVRSGDYGNEISFVRKAQLDLDAPCLFILWCSQLVFHPNSKHALKGSSLPFLLER